MGQWLLRGAWVVSLWISGVAGGEAPRLAKFEPPVGCYIGAFIERDHHVRGDFVRFEQLLGREHASYFTYVGYGQPFPVEWVERVKAVGAVPHIAWEPNEGLRMVREDDYLREWAYAARRAQCPIFLRFASEMNGPWTAYHGNPELYIRKWRLVAKVMREVAPNVAMVWVPFIFPARNMDEYYPGDDAVDWVGVNLYSVHHHNGDPRQPADHEDPCALLEPFYRKHARYKPIMIAEYAATHFCLACGRSTVDFAIRKMRRLYTHLPVRFPRVKMINWFCWDTIRGGKAENNYSLLDNERIKRAYLTLTASDYFLKRMPPEVAAPFLPSVRLARTPAPMAHPSSSQWLLEGSGEAPEDLASLKAPSLSEQDRYMLLSAPLLMGPRLAVYATTLPPTTPRRAPMRLETERVVFQGLPPHGRTRASSLRLRLNLPFQTGVKAVAFRVDGRLRLITNQAPYELIWNLRQETPGIHTVEAVVYWESGERQRFGPVEIEVVR